MHTPRGREIGVIIMAMSVLNLSAILIWMVNIRIRPLFPGTFWIRRGLSGTQLRLG